MTFKKSGEGASKNMKDRERVLIKANQTADSIRELIRSMKMNAEEKIALEDGINNLAKEVESMLDRIGIAYTRENQKKLLTAYRKFLQHNIEVVNQRLNEKD